MSNLFNSCSWSYRAPGKVVVLGGSGFVGRRLLQKLTGRIANPPVYIIHRRRPQWLDAEWIEIRTHDLDDEKSLRRSLEGCDVLINLLRADGAGWYPNFLHALLPLVVPAGVQRYVHASSIDVYGNAPDELLHEASIPLPITAYAKEHLAAERLALESVPQTVVLRFGAIFGPGGTNIIGFAKEAETAPLWLLAARRVLYARRRMHLVSLEAVCATIVHLAVAADRPAPTIMLVTDDDDERNNFAFMQDVLVLAFGRTSLKSLPMLPIAALEIALRLRGRPFELVRRRFSCEKIQALQVDRPDFGTCLNSYGGLLARNGSNDH